MPIQDEETGARGGGSRSFILGLRIVILIAAGASAIAGGALGVAGLRAAGGAAEARFACPMHLEVRSAAPGQCPICQMRLEPLGHGAASGDGAGHAMPAMADVTAVENVRKHKILDFARSRSLLPTLRDLRGPASVGDDGVLTAVMYSDQVEALAADETATFRPASAPGAAFAVQRTDDPPAPWDGSTSKVRFRWQDAGPAGHDPSAPHPPAGAAGWLEVARKPRDVLGVPTSAILQSPEGPYVLTLSTGADGAGRFDKRPIRIGETFLKQGFAVVLSGLRPHERVVGRATFFVDADRRLGNRIDATDDRGGSAP